MRFASLVMVTLLAAPVAVAGSPTVSLSPFVVTCSVDDEIARTDRAAPERAALDLVKSLVDGDVASVTAALSPEARSVAGPADVDRSVRSVATMAPYTNLRIAHTYFIRVTGHDPIGSTICGKTLNDPGAVFLAVRAVPRQFHVEVTAHTRNNDWSAFVWLVPSTSGWQALAFDMSMSASAGRSAQDLMALAVEQERRGHDWNAMVLGAGAELLSRRGGNATPVWKHDLDSRFSALRTPEELAGPPPLTWALGGKTYSIKSLRVLGIAGNLNLQILRRTETWPGDQAVDAENHHLLQALVQAHPELQDSFAAIVVTAIKPDETGSFGTVYEFGKGAP